MLSRQRNEHEGDRKENLTKLNCNYTEEKIIYLRHDDKVRNSFISKV